MSKDKAISLLRAFVKIRQNGVRSVNIEADLDNKPSAEGYVLTPQVRGCLDRIVSPFNGQPPTRAWTLTGPYGSGKSYFSLFLMRLFGVTQSYHPYVFRQLASEDSPLAQRLEQTLNHHSTQGLMAIPITCYRASLTNCFKHGLIQALHGLKKNAQIKPLLGELEQWTDTTESRAIIRWLRRLLVVIAQPEIGYLGALLVFDELGKPLEFSAAHPEIADIYLLQELAEFANRSGETPLIFVSVLHQAFERYAVLLDLKTQQEWAKVQGRFEDIAFQEPPNQQIRLLASAIEYPDRRKLRSVLDDLHAATDDALKADWCPPMMKKAELQELANRAYPLHPTALIVLPYFFKRLAQNERSLFAYLASHEPAGFQEFLHRHRLGDFIGLPELFDYLIANFQGRLFASGRARIITETVERLSSAANLESLEIKLVKTIGLLGWLAEVSHLQASESRIVSALRSDDYPEKLIQQTLQKLQTQSLIVYRRFNHTYAVWQGSDVDIEAQLSKARQKLTGAFSLAEKAQQYLPPRPIVARRHSYQTGTLRYFELRYVDSFNRPQMSLDPVLGANGLVLLCLPQNPAETKMFLAWAQDAILLMRPNVVVGVAEQTARLHDLLYELLCLRWVRENTPELRDDPVARRELRARLTTIETLVLSELTRALSAHHLIESEHKWFHRGQDVSVQAQRGLSYLLSKVCDELYPESPVLWNEIVNRRALSSQGAAARRNLIEGMLMRADATALGIEGFPPERSMYESLLKASGLHRPDSKGKWRFGAPSKDDSLKLQPIWDAISTYVFAQPPEPRALETLFQRLKAAPFGLTDGVLPVLLCAFLVAYQGEATLYREGSLLPEPGIADWEVLLRRPELFAVAGCRVTGTRATLVERFARGLKVDPAVMPIVRTLVRMLATLPEYASRTTRLSPSALGVRTAIAQARSPERLLFHDLPSALEMEPLEPRYPSPDQLNAFFARLNAALSELNSALPHLMMQSRDDLLMACGLETGEVGWGHFRALALQMKERVTQPGLAPLLKRAAETDDPQAALESVLAYVANRPPRTWADSDAERFGAQARHYGEQFQLEHIGVVPENGLTPKQRQKSRALADNLRRHLNTEKAEDLQVIRAALQALIQEYLDKTNHH
jgi:hypothetical protein